MAPATTSPIAKTSHTSIPFQQRIQSLSPSQSEAHSKSYFKMPISTQEMPDKYDQARVKREHADSLSIRAHPAPAPAPVPTPAPAPKVESEKQCHFGIISASHAAMPRSPIAFSGRRSGQSLLTPQETGSAADPITWSRWDTLQPFNGKEMCVTCSDHEIHALF